MVSKLGPAGRYAERVMRDQLAQLGMTPPPGSVARYAHAADRLARLRARAPLGRGESIVR